MPTAVANGLTLAYETRGDPAASPLVLIMGMGMPFVFWPDAFVDGLVDSGFHVVYFDNRDCGHSEKLAYGPRPNLPLAIGRACCGSRWRAVHAGRHGEGRHWPLDALGIVRAYVVGVSMAHDRAGDGARFPIA
jgi:proline iminopeptidase